MRLPTYDKPRGIACAEDHLKHIALPRGCLDEVRQTIEALKIQPVQRDERYGGSPLNVSFCCALRPQQLAAALALLQAETGVPGAPTASGQSLIASWVISAPG